MYVCLRSEDKSKTSNKRNTTDYKTLFTTMLNPGQARPIRRH